MVKAVGARTIGWMYRAAITRGVLAALAVLLWVQMLDLPRESALGEIARLPFIGCGGHGCRCGRMYRTVVLTPDGQGSWKIEEDGDWTVPGAVAVDFTSRRGRPTSLAAPTRTITSRMLRMYDSTAAPVILTPDAVTLVRAWWEENYLWGHDFDEAMAGRLWFSEPIPDAYVQNGALLINAACVAWCVLARAFARQRAAGEKRRRTAGLCVACGYPVLELGSACPECGREYQHEDRLWVTGPVEKPWDELGGGPFGSR